MEELWANMIIDWKSVPRVEELWANMIVDWKSVPGARPKKNCVCWITLKCWFQKLHIVYPGGLIDYVR